MCVYIYYITQGKKKHLDFLTPNDSEQDINNVDYIYTMCQNWVCLLVFAPTSTVLLYLVMTEK